ncbi:MAG TPA: T9SS type A sorting domain-containing protein [Candidatus Kapabacteria bacterium]|nr:T9SS type A sorting domain-containing protein [Candidatus Kapabacteria bacterium]
MKSGIHFAALLAAATVLWAAPLHAQSLEADQATPFDDTLRARFAQSISDEFGQIALHFWETRLNAYKVRIDEVLSGHDLAQLDELRARYAIMVARMRQMSEEREGRYASQARVGAVAPDTAVAVEAAVNATAADTAAVLEPDAGEIARREADEQRTYRAREERRRDSLEQVLAGGGPVPFDGDDEEGMPSGYQDLMELPAIARWLARDYREALDNVEEAVRADLIAFADSMAGHSRHFAEAHAAELAQFPDLRQRVDSYTEMDELSVLARKYPHLFMQMYRQKLEPFAMLYSGEALASMILGPDRHVASPVPDHSMLAVNSPNPAAGTTTIGYTLPEASAQTSLRLLDARGEVVMEMNEGAKEAGSYSATMDVSKLSSGWYMYQLRAQLQNGEQVSSRVMQVTR